MKVNVKIQELCDGLEEQHYESLELKPACNPDINRIKRLAFEKLHSESGMKEKEIKKTMKRAPYKILIAVAIIATLTTTAFATGGLDFFRTMFGDSVDGAGGSIQQMTVSAQDSNFQMTAEQLISDGFNTKVIVSLQPLSQEAKKWLSNPEMIVQINADTANRSSGDMAMTGSERLVQFDTEEKAYFCVSYGNNKDYAGQPITLTLEHISGVGSTGEPGNAVAEPGLALTIEDPESMAAQRSVLFVAPADKGSACYPISLTVNSISAVLTLQEPVGSTDTASMNVTLVLKDGTEENIFEAGWISEGDGSSTGGGGVVLADDPDALPLASGHSYIRDTETARIVQTANFSRIINLEDADYVLVDGTRYHFQK